MLAEFQSWTARETTFWSGLRNIRLSAVTIKQSPQYTQTMYIVDLQSRAAPRIWRWGSMLWKVEGVNTVKALTFKIGVCVHAPHLLRWRRICPGTSLGGGGGQEGTFGPPRKSIRMLPSPLVNNQMTSLPLPTMSFKQLGNNSKILITILLWR